MPPSEEESRAEEELPSSSDSEENVMNQQSQNKPFFPEGLTALFREATAGKASQGVPLQPSNSAAVNPFLRTLGLASSNSNQNKATEASPLGAILSLNKTQNTLLNPGEPLAREKTNLPTDNVGSLTDLTSNTLGGDHAQDLPKSPALHAFFKTAHNAAASHGQRGASRSSQDTSKLVSLLIQTPASPSNISKTATSNMDTLTDDKYRQNTILKDFEDALLK